MKSVRLILLFLCICCCRGSVLANDVERALNGLWAVPFRTVASSGTLILELNTATHTVKITESIDAEDVKNVAFIRYAGVWDLRANELCLNLSRTDRIRWTADLAEQIKQNVDEYDYAADLLRRLSANAPTLQQLRISSRMAIRQITANTLSLYSAGTSSAIVFKRIESYPSGVKFNVTKSKEEQSEPIYQPKVKKEEIEEAAGAVALQSESTVTLKEPASRSEENPKERVYNIAMVEQKPEFVGGEAAMYKWLSSNLQYPASAAKEGVGGRVVVEFEVSKTGKVENVHLYRGRHELLDKEAIRLVESMPAWNPARNNGQPVRCSYTLPVTFRVQ